MTENKRFEIKPSAMYNNKYVIHDSKKEYTFPVLDSTLNYMFCKALNDLYDENQELKKKNKQLIIDFMDFKMKLIEQLQIHYDYASEQRQKNICNPFIAKSYEIICCDVMELAEEIGVDLE